MIPLIAAEAGAISDAIASTIGMLYDAVPELDQVKHALAWQNEASNAAKGMRASKNKGIPIGLSPIFRQMRAWHSTDPNHHTADMDSVKIERDHRGTWFPLVLRQAKVRRVGILREIGTIIRRGDAQVSPGLVEDYDMMVFLAFASTLSNNVSDESKWVKWVAALAQNHSISPTSHLAKKVLLPLSREVFNALVILNDGEEAWPATLDDLATHVSLKLQDSPSYRLITAGKEVGSLTDSTGAGRILEWFGNVQFNADTKAFISPYMSILRSAVRGGDVFFNKIAETVLIQSALLMVH